MSKLFNLKDWLTVAETARHLTILFGEEVSEADVFRLILDKRIKLSVNFVNKARARRGMVVSNENSTVREILSDDGESIEHVASLALGDGRFVLIVEEVVVIEGVYDLPMIGAETLDIEHAYQQLTDGPEITLQCIEGAFVENSVSEIYQLVSKHEASESDSEIFANLEAEFLPAFGLPTDAVLVVRTDAIRDFERSLSDQGASTDEAGSLSETERSSLLKLALGMAMSKYDYNPNRTRNSATGENSGSIAADLATLELNLDPDTIRKYLKEAVDLFISEST